MFVRSQYISRMKLDVCWAAFCFRHCRLSTISVLIRSNNTLIQSFCCMTLTMANLPFLANDTTVYTESPHPKTTSTTIPFTRTGPLETSTSIQQITFGAIGILLALATIYLAYLQLQRMRIHNGRAAEETGLGLGPRYERARNLIS